MKGKGNGVAVGGADDDDVADGDDMEDGWVDPVSSSAQAPPTPAASTHARPVPLALYPSPAEPPPSAKDRIIAPVNMAKRAGSVSRRVGVRALFPERGLVRSLEDISAIGKCYFIILLLFLVLM